MRRHRRAKLFDRAWRVALPRPRHRARASAWTSFAALALGLVSGAGVSHLLHRHGHRVGLDLRDYRPEINQVPRTPKDYDQEEPGRGRLADRPEAIPQKGWTDIFWRLGASYFGDRIGFVAGGVTFFVMLSLFPTLAAFVTVYGLFADPTQASERLTFLYSMMPQGVADFLGGEMQRLAENSSSELTFTLIWTLLLSIWSANGAVQVLFYGLNVAYSEIETRNIVTYRLICLAFTVSGLLALLLSTLLVVGLPAIMAYLGLQEEWSHLTFLRWPVLFVGYVTALTLIYRYGPDRADAKWRWLRPGAIFAASLSLLLSLVFSWYVATFVRSAFYGPLAAMMGFMLWTWLTVQIVLLGAELNAETEHQTALDTTTGPDKPIGERGAVMADTVGARRGNPAALQFTQRHAEALADRLTRLRNRRRRVPRPLDPEL
jgi:Predicted membrane protein